MRDIGNWSKRTSKYAFLLWKTSLKITRQQPRLLFGRPRRRRCAKNNAVPAGRQPKPKMNWVPLAETAQCTGDQRASGTRKAGARAIRQRQSPRRRLGLSTFPPFPPADSLARAAATPASPKSARAQRGGGVAASEDSLRILSSKNFRSAYDGYAAAARGAGVRVGVGVGVEL